MNIGIIGATGNIGQRILAEALSREHYVTAFTRELSRIPEGKRKVTWKSINVLDSDSIAAVIGGLDLLVSTYDVVEQSIRNPETYVTAAKALPHHVQRRFTVGY